MTLLVREYTYNNFLRKLASECILIEMSGRVGQISTAGVAKVNVFNVVQHPAQ